MNKLNLLCIDDQREILAALEKDLEDLASHCRLEFCESAAEAAEVLDDFHGKGYQPALVICDHVMPGRNGVEFLAELHRDPRFPNTRKLLLTGLATHQDTIAAINQAHIDFYIEKPWNRDPLQAAARKLLTSFVLDSGLKYEEYLPVLDRETLYLELRKSG